MSKLIMALYERPVIAQLVRQELMRQRLVEEDFSITASQGIGRHFTYGGSEVEGETGERAQASGIAPVESGLLETLTKAGIPEEEARHYTAEVGRGRTLVAVNVPDDAANQVMELMDSYEPLDVEAAGEWGGVRVHSFGTERPVGETVSLREGNIQVNRRPVKRSARRSKIEDLDESVF